MIPAIYERARLFAAQESFRSTSDLIETALVDYMGRNARDGQALAYRAREYVAAKNDSVIFEQDVESVIKNAGLEYQVKPDLKSFFPDFLIGERMIVEAKSSTENVELAVGQAMLYKGIIPEWEVIIVVPYFVGPQKGQRVQNLIQNMPGISLMTYAEFQAYLAKDQ